MCVIVSGLQGSGKSAYVIYCEWLWVAHGSTRMRSPTAEELARFDAHVTVEVTRSPPEMAMNVIGELQRLGWLGSWTGEMGVRPCVDMAWQAYQQAEMQWRVAEPAPQPGWFQRCQQALDVERARGDEKYLRTITDQRTSEPGLPLYWKIDLPEVSKVLAQRGILPSNFTPATHPHATLLYLGGSCDDNEAVAKRANVSLEQLQAMLEALEALQGEVFEVRMTEIVIEEHVAVAMVSLPPVLPCANKIPHVTLGLKPGTSGMYANDVLEEVRAGRQEGITCIPLAVPRVLQGTVSLHYSDSASV